MSFLNIRKRHRKPLRIAFIVFIIVVGAAGWYLYNLYTSVFENNVKDPTISIYLQESATIDALADSLEKKDALLDVWAFRQTMKLMDAANDTVPIGHYSLFREMNNREIINMLRAGTQSPVTVIIRKARLWEALAEDVSEQLYLPADSLLAYMGDSAFVASLGFNRQTVIAMFLQDTYELYWTISAKELMQRMRREYKEYWTETRIQKAKQQDLTAVEVITLASIVEEETVMPDEKPEVAGLYLNRLHKGWKLQADPTIRFARKDFESKRVYFKHFEVDSKYNTYKYAGLPPGPICIPTKSSIEAVLNSADHEYMYMCAKPDFSGYHNFARTNAQHNINRQKYIRALREQQRIKREREGE